MICVLYAVRRTLYKYQADRLNYKKNVELHRQIQAIKSLYCISLNLAKSRK